MFNVVGLAMVFGSFAAAYAAGRLTGVATGEEQLMLMSGPLLAACDLSYRVRRPAVAEWGAPEQAYRARTWFHPSQGGQLFWIPAWVVGLLWAAIGAWRLLAR